MIALVCLHVTAMTLGFTVLATDTAVFLAMSRTANATLINSIVCGGSLCLPVGRCLVLIGVVTGLFLARPFSFAAPWLIGSYVLVTIAAVLGKGLLEPYRRQVLIAAQRADQEGLSALGRARWPTVVEFINRVIWTIAIGLMYFKP
jgi:hypothetical protein